MMLAELITPLSSASRLAAFSEWATPRSSAWRMRSLELAGWPSRSAMVRVCACIVVATRREASVDQSSGFMWRDPVSEVIWLRTGLRCGRDWAWDRARVRSRSLRHPERASRSWLGRAVLWTPCTGGREHPLRRVNPAGETARPAVGSRLRGRSLPPHRSVRRIEAFAHRGLARPGRYALIPLLLIDQR